MKRHFLAILSLSLVVLSATAQDKTTNDTKVDLSKVFKSDKEKFSYAIGMIAAGSPKAQLKRFDIDVDNDIAAKAFKDSLEGTNTLIPEAMLRDVLGDLNKVIKAKIDAKAEKNKADGIAFLEKNKADKDVVVLPSNLQYKVIVAGTGAQPTPTDEVSVNYVGTLVDGTEFDSSAKRGKPFTTSLTGGIIPGWKQILPLMKVGSKWKVFIPADLAYGPNPPSPVIPANSVLIFEMELLSTQAAPAPAVTTPGTPLTSDIIKVPSAEEIKKGAKIETIKAEDLDKEKAKSNK